MTDRFSIIPLTELLQIILKQYETYNSIFGIRSELFFNPISNKSLQSSRFGTALETPIGVAAGPQSQMAQNIVASWLTGARFIELKTIQTLDELEVSKPCIDMQDEGYNCEWSQELKLHESFEQYLDAWIIIHILRHKFGWNKNTNPAVIFNMSVGYDFQGILEENVQWFFNKMNDASIELKEKLESIIDIYPQINDININSQISNNITLSTMHGCPSAEIEKIGEYLITEKKLHTAIKLNPTLLGKEKLHEILKNSGFETEVPDMAFVHDLKFDEAIGIITRLKTKAENKNLQFSIKLTNTLESSNNKEVFKSDQKMMYMSGRALHPISINLAYKLQNIFNGKLDISFSGGADAFNIAEIINSGLSPVTVCTDLLKPGGYGRLSQYIEVLIANKIKNDSPESKLAFLKKYAENISNNKAYHKSGIQDPNIKTNRKLQQFDCIYAPCVDTCPTNQGIPDYLYYTSKGEFDKAAEIIKQTNPFPLTTGMICDHLCQTKCTRINYDSPVLIREIKRFISENTEQNKIEKALPLQKKAAIIGAGPSGLSCAYYLAKAGMKVEVFEQKSHAGGMASGAIPAFRLTDNAIETDIKNISNLGINIHYNSKISKSKFQILRNENDFVYLAAGAQNSTSLNIEGIESKGVLDPLDFLFNVKQGKETGIGKNVIIIGGGNTAMDAARTAFRLVGKKGNVTIVYRRKIKQMPADQGEIKAVMEEGINILELTSPIKINSENGNLISLSCKKMTLGIKDESGRATPIEIPNSEFILNADTIIPAIGQQLDIDFTNPADLKTNFNSYKTRLPNVFIGGDALRGASTAINAIGDGRKAAQEILNIAQINFNTKPEAKRKEHTFNELMLKKVKRQTGERITETNINDRKNFNLVSTTLTKEEAIKEASRCLMCDEICNICTTVCPNLAFHSYQIKPKKYQLQKIISNEKGIEITDGKTFEIKQKYQILHLADWCNQCGNCNTFCPTSGAPYMEKPHLYLTKQSFENNKDGCYLENKNDNNILLFYQNKKQCKLSVNNGLMTFESNELKVKFNEESLQINDIILKEKTKFEEDLLMVAQMYFIMQGAISFYCRESEK